MAAQSLVLLPAVDVVDGKAVRLRQGKAGSETVYGTPVEAAESFVRAGATWMHLVVLDAAFGRGSNAALVGQLSAHLPIHVEVSGGIRDDASLARALDAGAARVNIGTAALEKPEWTAQVIAEFGQRIAVGLDVSGETLATRGWTTSGGLVWDVLEELNQAGCARFVVTDIARDGMLVGPNIELLKKVCDHTDAAVVASGGIATLEDIAALRDLVPAGVEGAIIGKALYQGAFTLEQALAVASGASVEEAKGLDTAR